MAHQQASAARRINLCCTRAALKYGIPPVAEGNINYCGDIVKAIVVGADMVMLGSLLEGSDESSG